MDEPLYRARLGPGSISGTSSVEQEQLSGLIAKACTARNLGLPETAILEAASQVRPARAMHAAARLAQGNYFIGSCLLKSAPDAAREYFLAAIRHDPLHWRAWVRLIQCGARA